MNSQWKCPNCASVFTKNPALELLGTAEQVIGFSSKELNCPVCKTKLDFQALLTGKYDKSWQEEKLDSAVSEPVNVSKKIPSKVINALEYWSHTADVQGTIRKIGGIAAVEPLIAILYMRDKNLLSKACSVLGKLGDKRAVEPLIGILEDKKLDMDIDMVLVRMRAASALGDIGDNRAVEPLIKALEKHEVYDALACCAPVGEFEKKLVEQLLLQSMFEIMPVCRRAASALGQIGDSHAVELLIKILTNSKYEGLQYDAALALVKLRDMRALSHLKAWLEETKFAYQDDVSISNDIEEVATILLDMGSDEALELLKGIYKITGPSVKGSIREVVNRRPVEIREFVLDKKMLLLDKIKFVLDKKIVKIEVTETVKAPITEVWESLTNLRLWPDWWDGSRLESVQPGWEKGATLVWESGHSSTVAECTPPHLLYWSYLNMGVVIHRYFKLNQKKDTTTILYGVSVEGTSFPPGGEAKEKSDMKSTLQKFRRATGAKSGSSKKWWQFWRQSE